MISNEQAICEGGTCNLGDTCQEGSTGGFEKFYCDLNKGIYCKNTCLCNYNETLNFLSLYIEKENKCCLIHGSMCMDSYFYERCCERATCVTGVCQCNTGYAKNEENICQKTVALGETCDGVHEICATDLMCENNVCVVPTGNTTETGENTTETGGNTGENTTETGGNTGENTTEIGENTGENTTETGENTTETSENSSDDASGSFSSSNSDEDKSSFVKNLNFKFIFLFAFIYFFAF